MSMQLRRGAIRVLFLAEMALAPAACTSPATFEYPNVRLVTPAIALNVEDTRTTTVEPVRDRGTLERDERETFPEVFPRDAFVGRAQGRLATLASQGALKLRVEIDVERADVTFFSNYRDEFVRYDVTLRIAIRTETGELLNRGTSSAWRQLPKAQATEGAALEAHIGAAMDAFDRYFSDEERLNRLNRDLSALVRSRQPA